MSRPVDLTTQFHGAVKFRSPFLLAIGLLLEFCAASAVA